MQQNFAQNQQTGQTGQMMIPGIPGIPGAPMANYAQSQQFQQPAQYQQPQPQQQVYQQQNYQQPGYQQPQLVQHLPPQQTHFDLSMVNSLMGKAPAIEKIETPPGVYQVKVDKLEMSKTKDKGLPMICWTFKHFLGQFAGAFEYLNNVIPVNLDFSQQINVDAFLKRIGFIKGDFKKLGVNLDNVTLDTFPNYFSMLIDAVVEISKVKKGENTNIYIQKRVYVGQGVYGQYTQNTPVNSPPANIVSTPAYQPAPPAYQPQQNQITVPGINQPINIPMPATQINQPQTTQTTQPTQEELNQQSIEKAKKKARRTKEQIKNDEEAALSAQNAQRNYYQPLSHINPLQPLQQPDPTVAAAGVTAEDFGEYDNNDDGAFETEEIGI